jgi:hypothetical protein
MAFLLVPLLDYHPLRKQSHMLMVSLLVSHQHHKRYHMQNRDSAPDVMQTDS